MKRLVMFGVICIALTLPARAQNAPSPEALAVAQELANLFTAETIRQMTASQVASSWAAVEPQFVDKIDAQGMAEVRTLVEQSSEAIAIESMKGWPAAYAKIFTLQELRDLLAFYKTPTGIKTIRVMPEFLTEVSAQSFQSTQALRQDMFARMQAIIVRHVLKKL